MEKNWLNLIKLVKMILVSTDGVSINEQAEILSELVCEKFNEISFWMKKIKYDSSIFTSKK